VQYGFGILQGYMGFTGVLGHRVVGVWWWQAMIMIILTVMIRK
jgi:hypothetical protein